jgi:hypothetical protein
MADKKGVDKLIFMLYTIDSFKTKTKDHSNIGRKVSPGGSCAHLVRAARFESW